MPFEVRDPRCNECLLQALAGAHIAIARAAARANNRAGANRNAPGCFVKETEKLY